LARSSVAVWSIIALPRAYLKSYQPQATWPNGATPEVAIAAARRAFPDALVGGGMLTNFTELNRYRAAATAGDFVTHGTTAIVHAADDASVLQTLEALPQIFASAEAIAPGHPYRLGLVSIGMRSNPYGTSVAENPRSVRTPMAMHDPRLAGLFGAAFMVGAVAATMHSQVERIALAAPAGPLGLIVGDGVRPAWHVFCALTRLQNGERLAVTTPTSTATIAVEMRSGAALIISNLSAEQRQIRLQREARVVVLDKRESNSLWLSVAPRSLVSELSLGPFATAFVSFGAHDHFGSNT